ncbi:MAG: SMP-30/gluconolactonase/LRE family protein [Devosia sp.]
MNAAAELFIDSKCQLGEGALWHPLLNRLFWFDILKQMLFSADANGIVVDRFSFEAPVSAAGVIDADNLIIAAAGGLFRLELSTDVRELITPLEADKPGNRSNDGRVDRTGGFWIGTMNRERPGRDASGSLYQYRNGVLSTLRGDIHIPNSTCFSPDGRTAYFTDGVTRQIEQCAIDPATGLPTGPWRPFAMAPKGVDPDGSITDSEGFVWNCEWKGWRVVRYAPDGRIDRVVTLPVGCPTCPAFGGPDLKTLYITTARQGLTESELDKQPLAGGVFSVRVDVPGLPEPTVKL